MTTQTKRIFLDDLARRWRQDPDRIVELASSGTLPLWLSFTDVYVQKIGRTRRSTARKAKPPARERHDQVEVRPMPEVLAQILGRCDRMLIAAELPCLDAQGKPVAVTNTVGDEWGETSMIGLKPTALFALLDDVITFEKKNKIVPATVQMEHQPGLALAAADRTIPDGEHSCLPPELRAAIACWQALFAKEGAETAAVRKADIVDWLQQHHPELTKAALERIALVVIPAKNGRR